jgi:hypothetical protein
MAQLAACQLRSHCQHLCHDNATGAGERARGRLASRPDPGRHVAQQTHAGPEARRVVHPGGGRPLRPRPRRLDKVGDRLSAARPLGDHGGDRREARRRSGVAPVRRTTGPSSRYVRSASIGYCPVFAFWPGELSRIRGVPSLDRSTDVHHEPPRGSPTEGPRRSNQAYVTERDRQTSGAGEVTGHAVVKHYTQWDRR